MFLIKKIAASLILPPGIFIFLLLIIGFYHRKTTKNAAHCILFVALLLYLSSIEITKNVLLRFLERPYSQPTALVGDVIVVLGGEINGRSSDNERFRSGEGFYRLVNAADLWRRSALPIIYTGNDEAAKAAECLHRLGVPLGAIIIENKSSDTSGNCLHVKEILDEKGFQIPILVTSSFHMKRAVAACQRVGLKVIPYPCGYRTGGRYSLLDWLPNTDHLNDTSIALKEYLGILAYRFGVP